MRALIQRVTQARVEVDGQIVGEIGAGMLVLLGIEQTDTNEDADYLVTKVVELRIFDDQNGKMNLSLRDTGGAMLIVSQFTLYGDCRKGRRPSFDRAARPETAQPIYERFVNQAKVSVLTVKTGVFQAAMLVSLMNDGPVTLLCESLRNAREKK
jgi:D-tyrosyl-tRNA(Tyr) deacylase